MMQLFAIGNQHEQNSADCVKSSCPILLVLASVLRSHYAVCYCLCVFYIWNHPVWSDLDCRELFTKWSVL